MSSCSRMLRPRASEAGYSRTLTNLMALLGSGLLVTFWVMCEYGRASQPGVTGAAATEALPARSIASWEHGRAGAAIGRVHAGPQLLTAPLSGRRAVYYELTLTVLNAGSGSKSGDGLGGEPGKDSWQTGERVNFVLDDRSGRALVSVLGARFEMLANPPDGKSEGRRDWCLTGPFAELPEPLAVAARAATAVPAAVPDHAIEYRECALPLGAQVRASGVGMVRDLAASDGLLGVRIRLRPGPRLPVRIAPAPAPDSNRNAAAE